MSEFLSCPFCGSDEVFLSQAVQGSCWVVCENLACGAIGPTQPTPAAAAAAWNTRACLGTEEARGAWATDVPPSVAPEAVLPVEIESRRVGDMAAFRATEVELLEAFDPRRPCLGRAHERITGDLILVQVSGALHGGFAWVYARPRAIGQTSRMASSEVSEEPRR